MRMCVLSDCALVCMCSMLVDLLLLVAAVSAAAAAVVVCALHVDVKFGRVLHVN